MEAPTVHGGSSSGGPSLVDLYEQRQAPAAVTGAESTPKAVQAKDSTSRARRQGTNDNVVTTTTIGYVVTVTGCGEARSNGTDPFPITEGAAVLQLSIRRAASQQYDYKLYAIHHPDAHECVQALQELGYILVPRQTPVALEEIQGEYLREKIVSNGCCGEKELIKLEAWTLEHEVVVILDLDSLILKPLDPLFNYMLHGQALPDEDIQPHSDNVPTEKELASGQNVSLLYTIDYSMVGPHRRVKPVQGGFVVLRPSRAIYDDFVALVRQGDYRDRGGWGGKTGKFWGSMTFQGLVPYYFLVLHPETYPSVELNRCIYNNMCSPPREGDNMNGTCFTLEETCEDCRTRPVEQIVSTHYTVCRKPWLCMRHVGTHTPFRSLCRQLHHEWFRIRSELEVSWGRSGWGDSRSWADGNHFYGYCSRRGQVGYQLIQKPYGKPLLAKQ